MPGERRTLEVESGGSVTLPPELRSRYGLEEGATLVVEARENGLLLRPAAVLPLMTYSTERKAEFLLTNAVDEEDFRRAAEFVRSMGLEPEEVYHRRPDGS